MAPQLTVTMTADEARLLKSLDKVIQKEQQMRTGLKKTGDESKKTTANLMQGFGGRALGQLASYAAGFVSVNAAVSLVNQSLQEQAKLRENARRDSISVGQAQAGVVKNLGLGVSDDEARKFLQQIQKLQVETGFKDQAPLLQGAASILSATGGDQQQTLDILRTSATFMKDQPGQIGQFGGALGDIMKATGSGDAQDTAAFMLAMQGQARFESLSAFKNVAPVLSANRVVTRGDQVNNAREAGALVAGIGQQIADPDAAVTKTATIALASKLEEFFPELDSTFERLEAAQAADEETQKKIFESGFEIAVKPVIRELLTDSDSNTAKAVREAFAAMQSSREDAVRMESQLRTLTPELQAVTTEGQSGANIQTKNLATDAATQAQVQQIVIDTLQQARPAAARNLLGQAGAYGYGKITEARMLAGFDSSQDSVEFGLNELQKRLDDVERGSANMFAPKLSEEELTKEDKAAIKLLEDQIAVLQEMKVLLAAREREHADGIRREANAANQPD